MKLQIPAIRPAIWIAATLIFGLVIAGLYLGGRIVTARSAPNIPPPPAPHISPPVIVQNSKVPQIEPQQGSPSEGAVRARQFVTEHLVIEPQRGKQYIQVGAVNVDIARGFIQHLRDENLQPHIAPGPMPGIKRLLIGPFENRDALNSTKAQLESEGIATFVRQY